MSKGAAAFLGLVIGLVLYTPIAMYVFDVALSTMFDRAYFTLGGAGLALYVAR